MEDRVCVYLGIKPAQLMVCRVDGDDVVVVVNNGKDGCPKYRIPLDELEQVFLPEDPAEQEVAIDQDATDAAIELASKAGIDLEDVAGTGKGGRITVGDVRRAVARPSEEQS